MEIKLYPTLPEDAKKIREEVFVKEQGFQNEFDEMDTHAKHFVLYDATLPIATCRFFAGELPGDYVIGRIAVLYEYRGREIGSYLLKAAEKEIQRMGGKRVLLHAQSRVTTFYEKQGFCSFGAIDFDEACPHVWMVKNL